MKSGFATLVGRPNVGKSTLLNTILGTKVSIVSDKAQTTRTQVRGVLTRPDAQVVFVDTPGIHESSTLLNKRMMDTVRATASADVVLFLYRDELYNAESADRGSAEVIVAKHRNGPTGKMQLAFLDHYTRFANMARV